MGLAMNPFVREDYSQNAPKLIENLVILRIFIVQAKKYPKHLRCLGYRAFKLVEAAGIEPASVNPLQAVLQP
jgi:hypothetical protein